MGSSNAKYLYRQESGLAEKNQVDSEVTTSQQRAHAAKTNGVLGCISQKYQSSRSRRGSFLSTQLVRPHLEHWSSSGLPSTRRQVAPRRPFTISCCAFLHRSTVTRAAHPIQLWVTQYLIELSSPNYSPPSKRISDCWGNWLAVMGLKENECGQLT